MFKLLGQGGQGAALAGILLGLVQKDRFPLVVYHYTLLAECLSSRFFSRGVEFLARRALKVSVKPFQRLAGSKGRALGRSPQGAKHPRATIPQAGLVFLAQALPFCCRPRFWAAAFW